MHELERNGLILKRLSNGRIEVQNQKRKRVGEVSHDGTGVIIYSNSGKCYPYNEGYNRFNSPNEYQKPVVEKPVVKHILTNDNYLNNTKSSHSLQDFFISIANDDLQNKYNLRGLLHQYRDVNNNIVDSYLQKPDENIDVVAFPYYNENNEFQFAKLISYKGIKRVSQNYFNAYSPILASLNIGKQTKPKNIFFGQHLVPTSKNIVIIEGEKSAVALSEIFKLYDIVFLATGGLSHLKSLDFSCLQGKNVTLFPDKGASSWFELAKQNKWAVNRIIEDSINCKENDDVLDCFDKKEWDLIEKAMLDIVSSNYDNDKLKFQYKPRDKYSQCFLSGGINKDHLRFRLYEDDCDIYNPRKEECFAGINFNVYDNKFSSINANFDFNEWVDENGIMVRPSVDVQMNRIKTSYIQGRHINMDSEIETYTKSWKQLFRRGFEHLVKNSDYLFDVDYVMNHFVPIWDKVECDDSYFKTRNWRYTGGKSIKSKTQFSKLLNDDRRLYKTNRLLQGIRISIDECQYIDLNALGIARKRDNEFIYELVQDYNKNVIGCSTSKQWANHKKIVEYVMESDVEFHNYCNANDKLYQNGGAIYYSNYIRHHKSDTKSRLGNKNVLGVAVDLFNGNRRPVIRYNKFRCNINSLDAINTIVDYYLKFQQGFDFIRTERRAGKRQIVNIQVQNNVPLDDMKARLNEVVDLTIPVHNPVVNDFDNKHWTQGVFSISEEDAIERGKQFYFEWLCMHEEEDLTLNKKRELEIYANSCYNMLG